MNAELATEPQLSEQISEQIRERRETVFLYLAGVFICSMTLLNLIGLTKFIQLGPLALAVGVLPYPLTFLCTDLVCELYGKRRANRMVTVGLVLNFFILATLWLGNAMPASHTPAPWQTIQLAADIPLPSGASFQGSVELFELIYTMTSGAVFASMLAYVSAQYVDVRLFHYLKRLTRGKYLWLRNNLSTLVSQGVDSLMVISVTFGAALLDGQLGIWTFVTLMGSNYLFKMCAAILDTPLFYFFTWKLSAYLQLDS